MRNKCETFTHGVSIRAIRVPGMSVCSCSLCFIYKTNDTQERERETEQRKKQTCSFIPRYSSALPFSHIRLSICRLL